MPYMAPEQFADFRKVRFSADIYSLGKILYEAISGKLNQKMVPFKMVNLEDPDTKFLKAMDSIIRKATDENHHKRYQTVSEMRQAILNALKSMREEEKRPQHLRAIPIYVRWLWVGIASVLISVGAMAIYHLLGSRAPEKATPTSTELLREKKNSSLPTPDKLAPMRIALDGRELKLVKSPKNDLIFYGDPSLVTFHHYAEFLNEVSESLTVNDGVVKHDEDIWIYLGDGGAPSDQIFYQNSRFYLRQAKWAPKPVIRVTWLGARAYALHYGKRLPTYAELRAFKQQFPILPDSSQETANDSMHSHMKMNKSIQNGNRIQHGQMVVKEWLSAKRQGSSTESLVVEWFAGGTQQKITKRYPWEGFYDVGFRTVLDLPSGKSTK